MKVNKQNKIYGSDCWNFLLEKPIAPKESELENAWYLGVWV